jgi:hypothetical protein
VGRKPPVYDRVPLVGRLTQLRKTLSAAGPLDALVLNAELPLFNVPTTESLTDNKTSQILGSYEPGKSFTTYPSA